MSSPDGVLAAIDACLEDYAVGPDAMRWVPDAAPAEPAEARLTPQMTAYRWPAHDDLDELVRWLHEWERSYRESQGWPTAPYRGEAFARLPESEVRKLRDALTTWPEDR